jgi:hypothetical protein
MVTDVISGLSMGSQKRNILVILEEKVAKARKYIKFYSWTTRTFPEQFLIALRESSRMSFF